MKKVWLNYLSDNNVIINYYKNLLRTFKKQTNFYFFYPSIVLNSFVNIFKMSQTLNEQILCLSNQVKALYKTQICAQYQAKTACIVELNEQQFLAENFSEFCKTTKLENFLLLNNSSHTNRFINNFVFNNYQRTVVQRHLPILATRLINYTQNLSLILSTIDSKCIRQEIYKKNLPGTTLGNVQLQPECDFPILIKQQSSTYFETHYQVLRMITPAFKQNYLHIFKKHHFQKSSVEVFSSQKYA